MISGIRFASFAVADGQSLYIVAKLLGHKQIRTTERYAHLAADPILAAADKTASRVAAAMGLGHLSTNKTDEPNNAAPDEGPSGNSG